MAEVLSQTEIDALLAAVSSGNVETATSGEALPGTASTEEKGNWVAYDLTSQEKVVKGRLVGLQGIHERFSRLFRATLTNTLKKNATVTCLNTDFLRFSDYLSNVLLPASLNVITIPDLKGHMLFVVSSKLTYALVDAYFGGSERPFSKVGGKDEFTAIENTMIKKICQLALRDMREAWKLNFPLELQYQRSESNPHFVGAVHGSEMVAVVTFEVEFENLSGPFVVVIQLRSLDPVQQYLSFNINGEMSDDYTSWTDHWVRELMQIELEMRVELGSAERTLTQVGQFKNQDVLLLGQDAVSPLTVQVAGLPKFKGMMGACHGNTAIKITELVKSNEQKKIA